MRWFKSDVAHLAPPGLCQPEGEVLSSWGGGPMLPPPRLHLWARPACRFWCRDAGALGSHTICPGPATDSRPHLPSPAPSLVPGSRRSERGVRRPQTCPRLQVLNEVMGEHAGDQVTWGTTHREETGPLSLLLRIRSMVNNRVYLWGLTTLLLYPTLLARGLVHGKCSVNSRGEALTCRHRPARPLSQRPSVSVQCPCLPCPRCRHPWTFTTLFPLVPFSWHVVPPPLLCFLSMLLVLCSRGESSRKPAAGHLWKLIAWGRIVLTRLEPSMLLSPTFGMVSHCNPPRCCCFCSKKKRMISWDLGEDGMGRWVQSPGTVPGTRLHTY